MIRQRRFGLALAMALAGLICSLGCSRGPKTPDWNPDVAADACMQQYDTDSDGFLDKTEILASPSLKGAARNLDTDGDKKLSRDEIFERIETYQEINVNMQALVEVYVKNQKLLDAEIEFVPEDFLAGFIEPAFGSSDRELGVANMTREPAAFSPAAKATMRSSKPWACIGISLIWCGYSSLHFSIFGKAKTCHSQMRT